MTYLPGDDRFRFHKKGPSTSRCPCRVISIKSTLVGGESSSLVASALCLVRKASEYATNNKERQDLDDESCCVRQSTVANSRTGS